MTTNPNAIKVLCYGDSNTWGYVPITKQRYPVGVRWTSILQEKLGSDYWIIEEGLNSRTTNIDDSDKPGRNGLTYLKPCLESHSPIDLVVVMLGTNDMKEKFAREPRDIANAISSLLDLIETKIILVSPPLVDESVSGVEVKYKDAGEKSKMLGELYRQVAEKHKAGFVDIAQHVNPSKKDGYHLEPESHAKIAEVLQQAIINPS